MDSEEYKNFKAAMFRKFGFRRMAMSEFASLTGGVFEAIRWLYDYGYRDPNIVAEEIDWQTARLRNRKLARMLERL